MVATSRINIDLLNFHYDRPSLSLAGYHAAISWRSPSYSEQMGCILCRVRSEWTRDEQEPDQAK